MKKKLRPCPFCEGEAKLERVPAERGGFYVECQHCGAWLHQGGLSHDDEENEAQAEFLWNHRGQKEFDKYFYRQERHQKLANELDELKDKRMEKK